MRAAIRGRCPRPDRQADADADPPRRRDLRAVPRPLRPPTTGPGRGRASCSGVSGLCDQLLFLLREQGATHVGCATDRVIESFRNDLLPRLQVERRHGPGAARPVPDRRGRRSRRWASSSGRWSSSRRTTRSPRPPAGSAADPAVERILICTPDKDMAQLRRGRPGRALGPPPQSVLRRRRRPAKWGVAPASIPDWLALVGDSADGFPGLPGWGAKSAAAVLAVYGSIEKIPQQASKWEVPSLRGAPVLAATLRDHADEVMLYRSLARLRTLDDGVCDPASSGRATWSGAAHRARRGRRFCDQWGLERLRSRPASLARGVALPYFARPSSAAWCAAGAATAPMDPDFRARSNHGPPSIAVTVAPGPLGDQGGRRDVPVRHPALLDERVEPAVARRRPGRATPSPSSARSGPPCGSPAPGSRRTGPSSASEITKSVSWSLPEDVDRAAVERRGAVGRRREALVAGRIEDDARRRPAVDDEPDRDAEHRQAVRVVDACRRGGR